MQKKKSYLSIARISKAIMALAIFLLAGQSMAYDKVGRLGIGCSNELNNGVPALSFKIQKNRTFSMGALLGFNSDETNGGLGAGVKFYRNIFDEPQLSFYLTGMGAILNSKVNSTSYSGFQFDLGFGSEFHLTGLNSIGFSFEFGASATKKKNFNFQTMGNSFVTSGIHFYL